ncbi:cell surface glycoprotein 1 [Dermacentor silvarum]|uniref:cell surface glycoprotein 1 n=1 Tax=Dermacentor silvarum TaxID=543639 RepID=UPI00189A9E98|nr:cell surface glycoprotein 1 [Dermacentor silvarum]
MTSGVYTAVLMAITLAICPASNGQYSFGCPSVDDVHDAATILPNPFNCSTFYICAQGTPLLFVCPGNLQFNYELQVCDYPERANCFEFQQYPEPATTNFPVFQPEIEHLLPEQGPQSEHEAVPEQTSEQVVLTPGPKPGPSHEGVQPDSQGMVVPSESVDEPLQTRSAEQIDKDDVVEASEPIGAPKPQPSQEQAEPERQQKDNEGSDDTERELEPLAAPTDGAPGLELQPAANPTEPGIQDTVVTAESIDEPNPARSQKPTKSDHETEPQPSKEQAEPESERDINAHSEQELGPTIEPTDSAPEQEPQPSGNPRQTEQQDMVLPAESADETIPARSQEPNETDHSPKRALESVVSAPESEAQPSREQAVPEREPEGNEDATQTQNEQAPATEPNAPTTDSEPHQAEKPAKSEHDTKPSVQQVELAGEQEQAPSEKLAATTLQPEPQRTDGQAVAETAEQSDDFQPSIN